MQCSKTMGPVVRYGGIPAFPSPTFESVPAVSMKPGFLCLDFLYHHRDSSDLNDVVHPYNPVKTALVLVPSFAR